MHRSIAIAALIAFAGRAAAQECGPIEITSTGIVELDYMGLSSVVHGQAALFGSPMADTNFGETGRVTSWINSGISWANDGSIVPPVSVDQMRFGHAVDMAGDIAMVSAVGVNEYRGEVYFYRKVGQVWQFVNAVNRSGGSPFDYFGNSVSLSSDGRWAAVGATNVDKDGLNEVGMVYVYRRIGNGPWSFVQAVDPPAGVASAGMRFGHSVAIDDGALAVGSPLADSTGLIDNGHVAFYRLGPDGQFEPTNEAHGDMWEQHFGASVALSGDTAVVGAPWAEIFGVARAGYVSTYERGANGWFSGDKWIYHNESVEGVEFGHLVAIDGDVLAAAAPGGDLAPSWYDSEVQVYRRTVDGPGSDWHQTEALLDTDVVKSSYFATRSLSVSGARIFIGDQGDTNNGLTYNGAGYMYTALGNECVDAAPIGVGSYSGCTETLESELNLNPCGDQLPPGGDVWFTYTPVCGEIIHLDTNGSAYDTVLSVHTGCPGDPFAITIACDDDGGDGLNSALSFEPEVGSTCYIRVAGYNGADGRFVLTLGTCSAPCPADMDVNGVVNIFDFLAFQTRFGEQDPVADMNGDGTFNIFDFLAFQSAFSAGC